ncbi:MAG: hypothetical protein UU95_C0007G0051 [Parcubacteria group bacterium GW2011_GWC2_42_12]|nr:MAG: hypothetical protein UU95_C0007G0051 [Parcubacteria group bacterium GW2011_GWC2_42_12]
MIEKKDLKGRRILIFQQRGWGVTIGHFLATKLQAEGCKLAALTFKKSLHEYVLSQAEVKYELIINDDEIMENPKAYLAADDYSLKAICEDLGVDSIWPIVMSLRNHVYSYKDEFYYSYKQNVPDEEIIDYIKAVYKYIKEIFHKFNPEIIIAPNFVALPHIMLNLYAQKRGVIMTTVTDCKIKNYCIFTHDYNESSGPFYDRVDALNNGLAETANRERARIYIKDFRQIFKRPVYAEIYELDNKRTIKGKIRHTLSPYYQIFIWYFRRSINHMKNIGITVDYRPPKIILRDHYCQERYKKIANNLNYYSFAKVNKFVYFPWQYQPEVATDVIAPYFINQIEVARQVAMSLPDDYTLVVKDHPAMLGFRSPANLERMARTVNVKLIDYRISSEQVLKRASLVISHNSTTLAEAAFYNKPAIQLGNLGKTLKLPNVFKYTDLPNLSKKIKEVLGVDLKTEDYERKLENYVAAVYDTGFELDYWGIWERGKQGDMEYLWQMWFKLIFGCLKD